MGTQTLTLRQARCCPAERLCPGLGYLEHAAALLEIHHAEGGRKARRTRRRQDVIGTSTVIAQRLAGVRTQKNRAGMADMPDPATRCKRRYFQVFRRNPIG